MKKKCITGLVVLLCVIGFSMTGCGSDGEKKALENAVPVEEVVEDAAPEETEETVEEPVVEEDTEDNEYAKVGDVLSFENGNISIEDMGIYSQDTWAMIYVVLDMENTSDQTITIMQADASIYVDDYQIPLPLDESVNTAFSSILEGSIKIDDVVLNYMSTNINPGRKSKYIMFSLINDTMEAGQKVEYEILGYPILFKENGTWNYGSENGQSGKTEEWGTGGGTSEGGIGNPVIDSDPDRYIPEGVSGEIDAIDDGFYADSGNIDLVPGEYYIIGGSNAILIITEDTISMSGGKTNFDNAEIKPAENGSPQYWVYVEGNYYAVVSFFDGGLYFRTDEADSDEDWDEGFYLKF